MKQIIEQLRGLLADTYALYLKTQNYHWHVKGARFKTLHELFDQQYHVLADAVDDIAERILMNGSTAPATFQSLQALKSIPDGDSQFTPDEMLADLSRDHTTLINDLNALIISAQHLKDEGLASMLSDRIAVHQKLRWMLDASQDQVV